MTRGGRRAIVVLLVVAIVAVVIVQGPAIREAWFWVPLEKGILEGESWHIERHRFEAMVRITRGDEAPENTVQVGGDRGDRILVIFEDDRAVEVVDDTVTWHAPRDWDRNPLVPPADVWVRMTAPTPNRALPTLDAVVPVEFEGAGEGR